MTLNQWTRVTLELGSGGEDALAAVMEQYNHLGCEVLEDGGQTTAQIYFADKREAHTFAEAAVDAGKVSSIQTVEQENWQENWRQFFQPVQVTDRIQVLPAWRREEATGGKDAITILMEPGMAFGTGTHPTTQLCMKLLEQTIRRGDEMLDAGTGTGILCLVAVKLGARWAVGYDLDPAIMENAAVNRKLNGIGVKAASYFVGTLSALRSKTFSVVSCNMLSREFVPLLGELAGRVGPRGRLILSGLLQEERDEIVPIVQSHGLQVKHEQQLDEWAGLVFERA